jgi:hypothetical protein
MLFTGIVEFLEPSEAKTAFTKLAYTKFKHLPLYLEWAPSDTFTTPPSKPNKENRTLQDSEGNGSTAVVVVVLSLSLSSSSPPPPPPPPPSKSL